MVFFEWNSSLSTTNLNGIVSKCPRPWHRPSEFTNVSKLQFHDSIGNQNSHNYPAPHSCHGNNTSRRPHRRSPRSCCTYYLADSSYYPYHVCASSPPGAAKGHHRLGSRPRLQRCYRNATELRPHLLRLASLEQAPSSLETATGQSCAPTVG